MDYSDKFDNEVRAKVYSVTAILIERGCTLKQIDDFWNECIRKVTKEKQHRLF